MFVPKLSRLIILINLFFTTTAGSLNPLLINNQQDDFEQLLDSMNCSTDVEPDENSDTESEALSPIPKRRKTTDSTPTVAEAELDDESYAESPAENTDQQQEDDSSDQQVREDDPSDQQVQEDDSSDEQVQANLQFIMDLLKMPGPSIPVGERLELSSEYAVLISVIREIVKFFRQSCNQKEELKRAIGRALILDCQTRWSSMFDMVKLFLDNLPGIKQCLVGSKLEHLITQIDSDLLATMVDALGAFDEVRKILSSDDSTIGDALATFEWLKVELDKPTELHQKLLTVFEDRLNKYIKDNLHIRVYLCITDADYHDPNLNELVSEIVRLFQWLNPPRQTAAEEEQPVTTVPASLSKGDSMRMFLKSRKPTSSSSSTRKPDLPKKVKSELLMYRGDDDLPHELTVVRSALESILSSTVIVERLFSNCQLVNSKIRNRMEVSTLNDIVILKSFFNLKDKFY